MTKAPYEGAIEETAKAAGQALDIVKGGSQAIADIYGLIIGDQLHAARHRRLDAITRRTQEILKERDAKSTEVPEQIAIPLLEAAQAESRSEMQELWSRLLANAIDSDRAADVRPEFIVALKKFQPLDALVLQKIKGMVQDPGVAAVDPGNLANAMQVRQSLIRVSLDSLASTGCLAAAGTNVPGYASAYRITSFGIEFLQACRE